VWSGVDASPEDAEFQSKNRMGRAAKSVNHLIYEQLYYGSPGKAEFKFRTPLEEFIISCGGIMHRVGNPQKEPQIVGVKFYQGSSGMSPKIYRYKNYKGYSLKVGDHAIVTPGGNKYCIVRVVDVEQSAMHTYQVKPSLYAIIE
jgi:hypothetical protein